MEALLWLGIEIRPGSVDDDQLVVPAFAQLRAEVPFKVCADFLSVLDPAFARVALPRSSVYQRRIDRRACAYHLGSGAHRFGVDHRLRPQPEITAGA
jgi:hypothetical protein